MNRQDIHREIESILKAIQEKHEEMSRSQEGSIPQEELDALLVQIRKLYETALSLNYSNALELLKDAEDLNSQKILAAKRAAELKQTEERAEELNTVQERTSMDELIARTASSKSVEEIKKERTAKSKRSVDLNSSLFEDLPTLGGKFETEETFHSKISTGTSKKTVSESHHLKPIKDLKAAIGINEKFLFINKLFDGSLQEYSQAIEKINSSADLESAKQFIATDLASRFNWEERDSHVKNFMELVERRFIS